MDGKIKLVPLPGTTMLVRQPTFSGLNRRRSNHSRRTSSTGSLNVPRPFAPVPPPAPVSPIHEVAEPFPSAGHREHSLRPETPAIPVIAVQKPTPDQSVRTDSPPPRSKGSSKRSGRSHKHTGTPQTPNEKAQASEAKQDGTGSASAQKPPEPPELSQVPLTRDALESLSRRSSADLRST